MKDLILLTGNYTNFFGKLFYKNKLKDFEQILNSLKKTLKIDYILKFNVIMNFKKKTLKIIYLNISKSLQTTINCHSRNFLFK